MPTTVLTVAAVGLAHSCSAARRRGEGSPSHSSGPPTGPGPGTPPEGRCPLSPPTCASCLQRNHLLPELKGGHFPNCAPRRTPSPERLYSAPPAEVTRSKLPFSCFQCHGSPASTWCRKPQPTSPQAHSATPSNKVQPSRGPSAFRTDRHRITAPARPAARHHGTRGPADEGN